MKETIVCVIIYAICNVSAERRALRVVNGRDTEPSEFPYAVRIELHAKNTSETIILLRGRCSGAAISPTWVLTNAYCVTNSKTYTHKGKLYKTKAMIRYGNPHLNPSKQHELSAVKEVRTPGELTKITIKDDDIALLNIEPIKLESYARINVVDYSTLAGREATIIGFGKMRSKPNGTVLLTSSTLNRPLQVLDKTVLISCNKLHMKELRNQVLKLCAVPSCGGVMQSVLNGDAGAPVVLNSTVVGIVSKITDQLLQSILRSLKYVVVPNIMVLTPVSPYVDWIERQITNE